MKTEILNVNPKPVTKSYSLYDIPEGKSFRVISSTLNNKWKDAILYKNPENGNGGVIVFPPGKPPVVIFTISHWQLEEADPGTVIKIVV